MTFEALIEIANQAYPDGKVDEYFRDPDGNHGDTLAKFIVSELHDTFDPDDHDEDQVGEAARVMRVGAREMEDVAYALERMGVPA